MGDRQRHHLRVGRSRAFRDDAWLVGPRDPGAAPPPIIVFIKIRRLRPWCRVFTWPVVPRTTAHLLSSGSDWMPLEISDKGTSRRPPTMSSLPFHLRGVVLVGSSSSLPSPPEPRRFSNKPMCSSPAAMAMPDTDPRHRSAPDGTLLAFAGPAKTTWAIPAARQRHRPVLKGRRPGTHWSPMKVIEPGRWLVDRQSCHVGRPLERPGLAPLPPLQAGSEYRDRPSGTDDSQILAHQR